MTGLGRGIIKVYVLEIFLVFNGWGKWRVVEAGLEGFRGGGEGI